MFALKMTVTNEVCKLVNSGKCDVFMLIFKVCSFSQQKLISSQSKSLASQFKGSSMQLLHK